MVSNFYEQEARLLPPQPLERTMVLFPCPLCRSVILGFLDCGILPWWQRHIPRAFSRPVAGTWSTATEPFPSLSLSLDLHPRLLGDHDDDDNDINR